MPLVSKTIAKLVEKFATGGNFVAVVVDTGGKFATGVGWSRKCFFLLTRNSKVTVSTKIRTITRNYA